MQPPSSALEPDKHDFGLRDCHGLRGIYKCCYALLEVCLLLLSRLPSNVGPVECFRPEDATHALTDTALLHMALDHEAIRPEGFFRRRLDCHDYKAEAIGTCRRCAAASEISLMRSGATSKR